MAVCADTQYWQPFSSANEGYALLGRLVDPCIAQWPVEAEEGRQRRGRIGQCPDEIRHDPELLPNPSSSALASPVALFGSTTLMRDMLAPFMICWRQLP